MKEAKSFTSKVFGCIAYAHILDEKRTELDPKVEKASSMVTRFAIDLLASYYISIVYTHI